VNVQEYILSGIVESYVLGLASSEERSGFEKMCQQYPEVLQARIDFELSLEKQAMQNTIEPSANLKQKIFNEINSSSKVISIAEAPTRKMNWWKYAAAVLILLFAGSLYWNLSLQKKKKELSNQLSDSNNKMTEIEQNLKVLQGNPAIKMARMDGTPVSPQSYTTVYWDTTSHDVYLLVNNLPKPASDQQYQLWALLNGQPIDMGMLEISEKPLQLYHMKNVQAAQAFAITLEKKGGSPSPTLTKMYVMGKL
jgi:anti-sigma-K factor RskA